MQDDDDDLGGAVVHQFVGDVLVVAGLILWPDAYALSDAHLKPLVGSDLLLQLVMERGGVGRAFVVDDLDVVGA